MDCANEKPKIEPKNDYVFCRLTIPLTAEVYSMLSINDDKIVLGVKNELLLYEGESKEISVISKEIKNRITCIIKLLNGNVVTGGQDKTIKIWDIDKKELLYTLTGHTSIIWDLHELEDNRLMSVSDDNTAKIWDLNTKKYEEFCKSDRHISSIALLKNNKVILASGRYIFLYDLKTKEQESFLDIRVWALKELSNGDVACGGIGVLYIISVTDKIFVKTKFPRGHNKTINFIIELENHKIVTASDETDLILWDPNDPDSMFFIKGHTDIVTSLCYISGNRFASASRDKTLKIMEFPT